MIAFEANARTFPLLRENLAANQVAEVVRPLNVALGAVKGNAALRSSDVGNRGMAQVDYKIPGEERVPTIDEELPKMLVQHARVALIKIDVEGAELEVLEGAAQTVARHRPVLCVEVRALAHLQLFASFLEKHGYWVVDCLVRRLLTSPSKARRAGSDAASTSRSGCFALRCRRKGARHFATAGIAAGSRSLAPRVGMKRVVEGLRCCDGGLLVSPDQNPINLRPTTASTWTALCASGAKATRNRLLARCSIPTRKRHSQFGPRTRRCQRPGSMPRRPQTWR